MHRSSSCLHLRNAIEKYGKEHFIKTVLTSGLTTQEQADAAERYWIGYFDSINNGYNIREGGSRGKLSAETRARMSESAKKRAPISEETREKLRKASTGRKHSKETLEKLKAAKSNVSAETREKLSAAAMGNKKTLGRKHSEESKAKMSAVKMGHEVTEETIEKIRATKLAKKLLKEQVG